MVAFHFFGAHVLWLYGLLALVLLTAGLTVFVFRQRGWFEPGMVKGSAANPAQVLRDNPPDEARDRHD